MNSTFNCELNPANDEGLFSKNNSTGTITERIRIWIREYLTTNFEIDCHDDDCTLYELGLDSISLAGMLASIEDHLGMAIPFDLAQQYSTIKDLVLSLQSIYSQHLTANIVGQGNISSYYHQHVNYGLALKLQKLKLDIRFVRSQGSFLYDSSGRRYIDFLSQYGALPFGHHPPEMWNALDQLRLDGEPIFAQPSLLDTAGELAKRLIEIAPEGLRYVTFSNSGAESVEAALKLARSFTRRLNILSTKESYHGKTLGALSATGKPTYQRPFGAPISGFEFIDYGDLVALENKLSSNPEHFAAFIVEPIQGEGGIVEPPQGYLRDAKKICHRFGTLLIIDEVQTGLGRTGSMFACLQEGICPDIMTVAKALGGGIIPIGATLYAEYLRNDHFDLKHSSTFAGNALASRLGLATISLLTKDDKAMIKYVEREGLYLKSRLQGLKEKYPHLIEEIRGKGFMLGIRFTSNREIWGESFLGIAAEIKELAQFVASYLLNVEGVRVAPTLNGGDVLRIQPPLNISRSDCDYVLEALDRTFKVLDMRHSGAFFQGIIRKEHPCNIDSLRPSVPHCTTEVKQFSDPLEDKFAFLMHPLNKESYAEYDTSLLSLDDSELHEFANSMSGLLDPVVGSSVRIHSKTGRSVSGDFIMISQTAEQLKHMSVNDSLVVLKKALSLAKRRGALIAGLGAYTSVVSGGGTLLTDMNIPLTTGNSYTVASTMELLDSAFTSLGMDWRRKTACVVGATGSIGRCIAVFLAERVDCLVLIGSVNQSQESAREKLSIVATHIIEHLKTNLQKLQQLHSSSLLSLIAEQTDRAAMTSEGIVAVLENKGKLLLTTNQQMIRLADIIVTATSDPNQSIPHDYFKANSLIVDISRPRSIQPDIMQNRPDIVVLDGGIIALPQKPRVGPYGLPEGTVYACMAETILLTLDRQFKHTSLGRELQINEIEKLRDLAIQHGFTLGGYQSFGNVLSQDVLNQRALIPN